MSTRVQDQRSLFEQLRDLADVADREGMYDAADYLRRKIMSSEFAGYELFRSTLETWRDA